MPTAPMGPFSRIAPRGLGPAKPESWVGFRGPGSGSGGQSAAFGEGVEGLLVSAGGSTKRGGVGVVGDVGLAGGPEPVVDAGEEDRGGQAGVGDVVAVGVRDAFDQAVQA